MSTRQVEWVCGAALAALSGGCAVSSNAVSSEFDGSSEPMRRAHVTTTSSGDHVAVSHAPLAAFDRDEPVRSPALAQSQPLEPPSHDDVSTSNNPLTLRPAIDLQDQYASELYDSDKYANDALLRGLLPIEAGALPVPQLIRATEADTRTGSAISTWSTSSSWASRATSTSPSDRS
jgi:hypothetical protein